MSLEHDELFSAIAARLGGAGGAAGGATISKPGAAAASDAAGKKDKSAKEPKVAKEKPQWGTPGAAKAKAAKDSKPKEVLKALVETPTGEKKDMSHPIASAYEPSLVEQSWNEWWEKEKFFTPDAKTSKGTVESKRFIMVIPPPNVTGSLHIGHSLTCAIEDALTRWHRMCGDVTLWVPGTDHAGIATQSVVERLLLKEEGLTRHDLGREKFLERVWAWKEKNGSRICQQLRRTASSVDWSREAFTMDANLSKATQTAFCRFYDQGLIYRDNRLVNWCPHLKTALSDLEVDHEDIPGKTLLEIPGYKGKVEVGVLCEFKYQIKGSKDSLTVATTRLETMLGDVAVAVHPADDRYKQFVGKELVHPFYPDRKMVVVADDMVDREFGTGCVKITPAHDPNDYKLGKKHKLEQINILTETGMINEVGGEFAGQHRFEARGTVEAALKAKGLWVDKKSHAMRLGFCSRSKDIIEPFLKPQWWMNCQELAAKSVAALREGDLKIVPEFHHDTWYRWLENIQEWCISRQLWWGHRIPAYKVVEPEQEEEVWVAAMTEEEALEKAKAKLGLKKGVKIVRDEDVLDTWFSSGLFPFSVFGWPDVDADEFNAFFPTSLLETGHDILFFWVARMVMMSIGLTGKLPFHTVYLHAMVRDAHGRKMSKSLGNTIDPLEVVEGISLEDLNNKLNQGNLPAKEIEKAKAGQKADYPDGIPECGADALRFGLLAYTAQGRNVNLDISRVAGYRRFCNKVWQGTRFGLTYFGDDFQFTGMNLALPLAWEDKWILSRLTNASEKANKSFEKYEFAEVTTACYDFFLKEFCDVYLELLKLRLYGEASDEAQKQDRAAALQVLYICLDWSLRLMHPLLPYLTEELYQRLPPSPTKCNTITLAQYPTHVIAWNNYMVEDEMEVASTIAEKIRSQKQSIGLKPGDRPAVYVRHKDEFLQFRLKDITSCLSKMAGVGEVHILKGGAPDPDGTLSDVVDDKCLIYMESAGIDLTAELQKVAKKVTITEKMVASIKAKLAAPGYEEKVPEAVREKNATSLAAEEAQLVELLKAKAMIEGVASGKKGKKAASPKASPKQAPKAASPKASPKQAPKKAAKEGKKAAAKQDDAAGDPEEARQKKLKKVIKEGGKRGVEIEGAADMGGLQFFSTSVDEPDGDLDMLVESMKAMNNQPIPGDEERKGCSGHIGKMIFSAGTDQLAVVAYVPKEKQDQVSCKEWLEKVLALNGGKVAQSSDELCTGFVTTDGNKNVFPLKIREPMLFESNNYLRKKGLFPEDDSDDDEMVFGDDDFPS